MTGKAAPLVFALASLASHLHGCMHAQSSGSKVQNNAEALSSRIVPNRPDEPIACEPPSSYVTFTLEPLPGGASSVSTDLPPAVNSKRQDPSARHNARFDACIDADNRLQLLRVAYANSDTPTLFSMVSLDPSIDAYADKSYHSGDFQNLVEEVPQSALRDAGFEQAAFGDPSALDVQIAVDDGKLNLKGNTSGERPFAYFWYEEPSGNGTFHTPPVVGTLVAGDPFLGAEGCWRGAFGKRMAPPPFNKHGLNERGDGSGVEEKGALFVLSADFPRRAGWDFRKLPW